MTAATGNHECQPLPVTQQGAAADRALIVEDSMIIAMDAEDSLRRLGVGDVVVAGSVATALEAVAGTEFDFALLDFNLGDESSSDVADALARSGVPFWFVTGYGDAIAKLAGPQAKGVLKKPFTARDLEEVVEAVRRL